VNYAELSDTKSADLRHLSAPGGHNPEVGIVDVFSRMIVGWQIARHMRTSLVLDALRMALAIRQPGADFQLVSHTDQGSQYTAEDYTQQLDDARVLASVGSVGDAYDNALAESFVDSYKTELIADRVWRSHAQLELASVDYVAWFNTRRLHSSLGNIPPVEHEQRHVAALAANPEALLLPRPALSPLNAGAVYDPFGVVSALRC
jgi:putative transposase